ncbi:D-inositol-3-phosphate glycosyltransferase [Paraburkholderia domus]|jgi:glycosyltransferase, MSMEG_0565 family|uniref:D-inositol-3-phosphate glycosyltransferase n=1 Tax=Paraburkholderia domus TaxID=2793075 RepID=A0A9N8R6G1_9BURK|nr:MSMEG_0565 family glycosyltransferase [Paraburkholderia domus]MBK5052697.1 MSMEG_0565 family glycosyltransferase [Burkholderia sp. R-70006]MBK5064739.1 MSMEG_0565 family glycosyltransferase [Burkholderia sp. R-70199]MBK5089503.1 MSMEG_0565 family glycosyltransferase [Burkholderia sp. R-69927]MBK5125817.1 MSMEG_0565 family glycosyltransferase [Burkholderia sp. R-69980]MBK5168717.1 MSMEG_0565 family glycosyltransferase [Burkholderia sp. R-70211]MBK5184025.1 MSMEG_0565 family glycosyltransfer
MNTSRLRIALLTHSVNPRGGVVHTLELARALHQQGHDVTIFAPAADGETMFRESPCRVVLARLTGSQVGTVAMIDTRIRALKAAVLRHDANAFDVLHAQDSISGNALAELKQERAIRGFLRTVHHLDRFDNPQLERWQRRAWHDADVLMCVSDTWTTYMRETFGAEPRTVSNGVDLDRYGERAASDDTALRQQLGIVGTPVVLAVGGVEERKNTLMLLDAFALLRETRPDAQLVIAGGASLLDHDTYSQRFATRAAQHGFAIGHGQPVVVTGPVRDEVIPALFRSADAVSMVSLREGFGLVVLEALASGKPVVVSQIAPFTEYLDTSVCCWAQPDDARSIAAALSRALDSRGGLDFVHAVPALLDRFGWAASARRHLDIYLQWLATQPLALH